MDTDRKVLPFGTAVIRVCADALSFLLRYVVPYAYVRTQPEV